MRRAAGPAAGLLCLLAGTAAARAEILNVRVGERIQPVIERLLVAGGEQSIHLQSGRYFESLSIAARAGSVLRIVGGYDGEFRSRVRTGAPLSIIDGEGLAPAVSVEGDAGEVSLEGLQLTGAASGSRSRGIGVQATLRGSVELRLRRVHLRANVSRDLAAVPASGLSADLRGAAYLWLGECEVAENVSEATTGSARGAGADVTMNDEAQFNVEGSRFHDNEVRSSRDGNVAALKVTGHDGTRIRIENSVFTDNRVVGAPLGRVALSIFTAKPLVTLNRLFVRNNLLDDAGATQMVISTYGAGRITLRNSLVADSAGNGVRARNEGEGVVIQHVTIANQGGLGLKATEPIGDHTRFVTLSNSIFFHNGEDWSGEANVSGTEHDHSQFIDAAAGDYRLRRDSPAIDAAVHYASSPNLGPRDLSGGARRHGPAFDRGPYEVRGCRALWPLEVDEGASACTCVSDSVTNAFRCAFRFPQINLDLVTPLDWQPLRAFQGIWEVRTPRDVRVDDLTTDVLSAGQWLPQARSASKQIAGLQDSVTSVGFRATSPQAPAVLRGTIKLPTGKPIVVEVELPGSASKP